MSKDREPPSRDDVPSSTETQTAPIEEPPLYQPDPDLITFLERDAKPGEVKVWKPDRLR